MDIPDIQSERSSNTTKIETLVILSYLHGFTKSERSSNTTKIETSVTIRYNCALVIVRKKF